MQISSAAFSHGGNIPAQFSRNGGNHRPPLKITSIPAGAKSLVLMVVDPDAPGGLFTHWLIWNIDPKTTAIADGTNPAGAVVGTNDFGDADYDGPAPPSGTHRYFFKIFALDKVLSLDARAKRPELERAMQGHVLAQAKWMGRFQHEK